MGCYQASVLGDGVMVAGPEDEADPAAGGLGGFGGFAGPLSIGGQFTFDSTTRDTDTPLTTSTTDTTSVSTNVFVSQYIDAEMIHEVGVSYGLTISKMDIEGFGETTTTSSDVFFFYHYNHAVNEQMKIFYGAGMGMRLVGTDTGGLSNTTAVELGLELPVGMKFFVNENMSVDVVNKLVYGFGGDSNSNETSSFGYNLMIGLSFYFGG